MRASSLAMVSVKICGVTDPDMAAFSLDCGADWIGVVCVAASPRFVPPLSRADIAAAAGARRAVALLVDPTDAEIGQVARAGFGIVQLHGGERPARVADIAGRFDLEVWKALGVAGPDDLLAASAFGDAHRLLVDAKPPAGATRSGGHGATFDWALLEGWTAPKPWLLAGGLNPDNVAEAIQVTGAKAVDVSSGVESARGVKDRALIRDFIQAAKAI